MLDHALEPECRCQRVGVRVVVHIDEHGVPATQTCQRWFQVVVGHVQLGRDLGWDWVVGARLS